MGTLFSTLNIGRSGLQVAQVQMDVAGHNIANVNKDGYSRQRASLTSPVAQIRSYGQLGTGVRVDDISRVREAFLDTVYRQQTPGLGTAEERATYFNRIEDLFQEPSDNGFGEKLNVFFNALSDFATDVEEQPVRMSVITEAETLCSAMNQMSQQLYALQTNANEEVRNAVPDINSTASQIASLNAQIREAEVEGGTANDLRDERDRLIDSLSRLVSINYRERTDGQIDINIGGDSLVNGTTYREIVAVRDPSLDPVRKDLVDVRFADNDQKVQVTDGTLHGALLARDQDIAQLSAKVDTIAATIIEQLNKIQSTGRGLQNLSGTMTGSNPATSAVAMLNAAGLPFTLTAGTFDVVVYNGAGTPTTTTVTVNPATMSLNNLAAALNAIPNFSASVTADNRLQLGAAAGFTYSFANDSSGALTALGINGLFTGTDARTMTVSQHILDDPRLLSSSYSTNILETGNNLAALDMAEVRNKLVLDAGTATINDYYESVVVGVGVEARANSQRLEVQQAFIDEFQRRRQEVSGVSIDEETTFMMQYQRGFEASARVITVINTMLDTLINMAR